MTDITNTTDDHMDDGCPSESTPTQSPCMIAETAQQQVGDDDATTANLSLPQLRQKLQSLKKQRRLLQQTREDNAALHQRLQDHNHHLQHQLDLQRGDLRAWKIRHYHAKARLEQSQTWNALNDAFFIWHQGPFATLNGVRLGNEAVVSVPKHVAQQQQQQQDEAASSMTSSALGMVAATVSLPGRYLGFSSADDPPTTAPTNNNNKNGNSANSQQSKETTNGTTNINNAVPNQPATVTTTIRVPWTEINSALGQVVLLLSILEQTPHAGISFPNHVLIPQGSTSKIGLRQPNAITGHAPNREVPIVALYHLYSDDSFSLFGKRNFNLALRALTECLARAANAILARDRTIVMPFPMQVEHDNPSAPCLIGGLPVHYSTDDGITWTRVMKYLLTNVKWCVAYAAKHVDR